VAESTVRVEVLAVARRETEVCVVVATIAGEELLSVNALTRPYPEDDE
jgi:hypothetical protein